MTLIELVVTPSLVLSDDMRQAFTSDRHCRNKPNGLRGAWVMAVGDATARCFAQQQQRRKGA
ncbi:MAG: hypothetical protein JNK14_05570 [Chitinophagaceae bacterium]|nr:hypothetical protein [Chitinophagaceae bacterium]